MNLVSPFSINMPGRVIAGPGTLKEIGAVAESFGAKKVLIVTDQGIVKSGLIEKPMKVLRDAGITTHVVDDVPREPTVQEVEELVVKCREYESDLIVGIGGGSPMDTAKIISVLIKNSKKIEDIMENSGLIEKGVPTLMIPTTSGTGSEATPNSIVTVPEQELKVGIVSRFFVANCVILDPELTLKLPAPITAATGMDALAHAIECYISKKANPLSDMMALKAIKLINENLLTVYHHGDDMEARFHMLLASFYGGMCIATSSTTAVHALAYPLGGKFKIAHGVSNAILLPYVMDFNKDVILDNLWDVADAMNIDKEGLSKEEVADKVIARLYDLANAVGIPQNLKEFGVKETDINSMVEEAAKVTRLLDNNPKLMTKEDIGTIFKKLI